MSRPLIELIGARWQLEAPVVGAAWDGDVAGFGLGDGTLALARGRWDGGSRLVPRAGGGAELVPAQQSAPPVMRAGVHDGACLGLVADPAGGFLCGGDDGRLARVAADGTVVAIASFPGAWADPVAAGPLGRAACAVGRRVHVFGPAGESIDLPSTVFALAFDPTGRTLAIGHYGGVTLWSAGTRGLHRLDGAGVHRALAWSPNARYLVSGLQENALHGWRVADSGAIDMAGYPGQPLSLSFSADGRFLATSGGPRVVCWRFDPPGREDGPAECGIQSRIPVTLVACHPHRPLIAAGYHNGAVLLCRPGAADSLFVRGSSGSPVSALAWSADGEGLAFGTEDGEAGLVPLPDLLLRPEPAEPARDRMPARAQP
ncbi:WD40 repeat domain-containing protein [Inquilinus limosus]|uniref:Anaphase-promoting complex subunit 4-like WD40 domain-containing protein n=1 Tax=Inquilinus limosus TaxID=171674 RepID=A0A211ZVH6_9PROT|nr:WD40 repeat domain-containing protein [Inquilinus limosus]OWJ69214.1 hypothetical protein BWR60_01395 [Inquilinus limosus]